MSLYLYLYLYLYVKGERLLPAIGVATWGGDGLPEEAETEGTVEVLCLHCLWINVSVFLQQGGMVNLIIEGASIGSEFGFMK